MFNRREMLWAAGVLCSAGLHLGGATAVSAQPAPKWEDVVVAAKKEGGVKMYSTMVPTINADLEKAFEATYPGIDLQITRIVGMEINATLDAERSTGADGADVVAHINFDWMFKPANADAAVPLIGPNATGPGWKGTPFLVDGKYQMSLLTALGMGWNTELTKNPPKSYLDLLKPEFANGRIGIMDNTHPPAADFYAWLTETFGADYLTKLAAQKPKFYSSAVPLQEAMLAGEVSVGFWGVNALVQPAKAKGAPVGFTLGDPGWSTVNFSYILSWSKRPNAAQVLLDFMASPPGQAVLGKGNISTQKDVPGTVGDISKITPLDYRRTLNADWSKENQANWRKTFGR